MNSIKLSDSIAIKLLKIVFLIYFSITLVITTVHVFIEYSYTKDSVFEELKGLEGTFESSLTNAIWEVNEEQLESIVKGVISFPIVTSLQIVSSDGKVLSDVGSRKIKEAFYYEFDVKKEGQELAHVKLYSSEVVVFDRLKLGFLLILLNAIFKSMVLWVLFIWAFKKYLVGPLQRFTHKLSDIDIEDARVHKIDLDINEKNELTQLQDSFNFMLDKIHIQKETMVKAEKEYSLRLENDVKNRTEALKAANVELKFLASVDVLTNVRNRRSFFELSEQCYELARRNSKPLSIMMFDLDNFKNINDKYGHAVGDEVLKLFAQTVDVLVRKSDVFARVGGEEFAIILPETSVENAQYSVGEKVLKKVRALSVYHDGEEIKFTVSIGVAEFFAGEPNLDNALQRADKALYRAKSLGRDQVSV
ncbi:GGDEF domain-containing protein [Fibrobacterales bacterium]|nr:GGDEF domain-containing protein [Fibrobacterales bacterium]